MRKILVLVILAAIGCRETKSEDAGSPAVPAVPIAQIQSVGCTVSKASGFAKISCADGSSASVALTAPKYFYPKDVDGVEYPGLVYAPGGWFNTATGNLLSYDSSGNLGSLNIVYFTNANCSGVPYMLGGRPGILGTVMLSQNASPNSEQAFKIIGYDTTPPTILSEFTGGHCLAYAPPPVNFGTPPPPGPQVKLQAVAVLDSTDPITMPGPVQLMIAQ